MLVAGLQGPTPHDDHDRFHGIALTCIGRAPNLARLIISMILYMRNNMEDLQALRTTFGGVRTWVDLEVNSTPPSPTRDQTALHSTMRSQREKLGTVPLLPRSSVIRAARSSPCESTLAAQIRGQQSSHASTSPFLARRALAWGRRRLLHPHAGPWARKHYHLCENGTYTTHNRTERMIVVIV
jgi:hypothetical protein